MAAKVFLIQSESIGRGDERLGTMLMANFLRLLGEASDRLVSIIFWNTGVRLACEGSEVLHYLKKLEGKGVEILACTTCLEYFDLVDKLAVGKATTMVKSVESLLSDREVISL
jgi:selenium metabolism protein YedF